MTTLRRSPLIDRPERSALTPNKEKKLRTWREDFVEAPEPAGGWPARPWDHWFVDRGDGMVERIAMVDGEAVLDAEGDEVMSGPGFDHLAVKSVPGSRGNETEIRSLAGACETFPELEAFLTAAADEAAYHGHPWVGEEHVALALARRGVPLDERPLHDLDRAIADFYEGPHAAARVRLVQARRDGEPFTRQPLASFDVAYSLGLMLPLLDNAAAMRQLDETAVYLLRRPRAYRGVLDGASTT